MALGHKLQQQLGLLRSLLIYYGQPWRWRRQRRFYGQFLQPGDVAFDVGAHVGNRLRLWTQLGARVVGLEPQPHLMDLLQRLYGRSSHITLLPQAVAAQPGEATLYLSPRTPTVTTLSRDWISRVRADASFARVSWDTAVRVEVTTLDALIARFGLPAFCKIDVEGYELEVLRGLSRPLPALSFEYLAAALDLARACVRYLDALGPYRFNWSAGESHRWGSPRWLTAAAMIAALPTAAAKHHSGDVYARLEEMP